MTKVRIPPTLREQTGGERVILAEGDTVRDLLDVLMSRFPALRRQLVEDGELASFACSDPITPGRTPSTPPSAHDGASSGGGGVGKRHR